MEDIVGKDFYCSASAFSGGFICDPPKEPGDIVCQYCINRHRKWPTPEQFRKEYGNKVSNDFPVWCKYQDSTGDWLITHYSTARTLQKNRAHVKLMIFCACTPFGKPEKNWRPE